MVYAPPVEIDPDLIDRLIELYCDWRVAHAHVAAAYDQFCSASVEDRTIAFAAYGAALDREQCACDFYAAHIRHVQAICRSGHPQSDGDRTQRWMTHSNHAER